MEAIGQKAVTPVTDEAIAATEFGMESEEKSEKKIFDATLEQMLVELPLDEKLLEDLLDEDSLSASLNSALLTQNQLDPEIEDTDFGIVNNSNIPYLISASRSIIYASSSENYAEQAGIEAKKMRNKINSCRPSS